jgi:hypothetical protein
MKTRRFVYVLPVLGKDEFPDIRKPKSARIAAIVDPQGEVELVGNSAGLAYLAKKLAAMSIIKNTNWLHVHLDPEYRQVDPGTVEITIRNLDFEKGTR